MRQYWQRRVLLLLTGLFGLLLIGESLLSSRRWINKPFPGFFVHENLTIGPYFVPGWNGFAAGLQSLDRVVSINGQELKNRGELYELVRRAPAGTAFQYRFARKSQVLDSTIASMSFRLRDWMLSFAIYMVIGLAFLVIGVAPYFYRASNPVALPL
jgi:hypothetical protein